MPSIRQRGVRRPKLDLRERALLHGPQCLADAELVALLLGTGTETEPVSSLALALLDRSGGLCGMLQLGPHALAHSRGVGPAKAARLVAAIELGRRAMLRAMAEERTVIGHFDAAVAWARPRLATLEHEEVWLLVLDAKNGLKSARRVAQGGLHGCALTARDVLSPAVRDAASAILLVHNHPSGDPKPSPEDFQMTRTLGKACELIGIPLLDHVIVARGGATSLFELGALDL
jgi:DNA repair protein RadC